MLGNDFFIVLSYSRCKSYEKAKKKLTIFQAPNILTIVLKRFQVLSLHSTDSCSLSLLELFRKNSCRFACLYFNYSFQAGNFTKLKKRVQFPEILNITPYMSDSSDKYPQYSLYAVVVHLDVSSADSSGHYVCYVKNYHEEWFKIDDSVVCLFLLTS